MKENRAETKEKSLKEQVRDLLKKEHTVWVEEEISKELLEKGESYQCTIIKKQDDDSFKVVTAGYRKQGSDTPKVGEKVTVSLEIHEEDDKPRKEYSFEKISEIEKFIEEKFPDVKIIEVTKATIKYIFKNKKNK